MGVLSLSSAGQGDMEISVAGIPNPYKAKKIINQNRDNDDDKEEHSKFSIADELQKLAALKEKGILTNSEFQKQKKKILNRS